MSNYTRLTGGAASFDAMLRRFGVVTVMNVDVFEYDSSKIKGKTAQQIYDEYYTTDGVVKSGITHIHLDTLKVSNITVEGPTKTVTGGQYSNPLIKYGKTARLEMQDALGNADALEMLGGAFIERMGEDVLPFNADDSQLDGAQDALHVGSDFCGPKTLVGESFFIEQGSGKQVPVKILFYQFMPDSIFNLTQDAEGDATVFDLNGDLLTTDISVGDKLGQPMDHGVFYSIIPAKGYASLSNNG